MGDGHDEPPQAAPRGRTPLKRRAAKKPRTAKAPGPRDSVAKLERALADATAREAHLARLLAINTRISALDSTEAVLTSIAEEAARLLGLDNTAFRIIDGDELVLAACAGSGRDVTTQERIRIGESLSGRVLAAGKTLEFSIDAMASVMIPEHVAADRRLGYTTFLGVPLRVGDRITGVLALRARRPFVARERELAEAFAAQAAVVLEHARLYEETQRARRQAERHARNLTALTDVTATMTSARSSESVFGAVTAAATRLLGARMARVWVVDAAAGVFRSHRGHASDADAERALDDYSEVPIGRGILGRIFATRSPEYVEDAWTDERWYSQKFVRDVGLHTFVGLPLISGERVLGVLSLLFGDRRPWSAEDAELGVLLANQAAIAIANADLHRAREQRAARMRALARLNQIVSSSLDTESVLAAIARTAVELVGAPFVHFWVLNLDRNVLEVGASSPGPAAEDFGRPTLDVNHGAAGWVARHRLPLEIADTYGDGRFFAVDWLRRHGLRSFYGMPLLLEERLLGVLTLFAPEPFRFTDDDHELLDAFAGQAAVALNNARLYREARESGDRLRALERVNRLISSSLQVEEVLGNVAGAVAEFFDAPFVSVWRYDEARRRLHRALIHGETVTPSELHVELGVGEGAVGWVVQNRAPIPWVEVSTDPRIVDAPHLLARGLKYFTAYPIAIGDRVLGAFAVSSAEPSTGTEALSLMASLGAQAAVALDHARLYGETTRRLDQTAALLEVSEILGSTLEARQLLKRVAIKIAQVTRVERCSIELWDGDRVIPLMSQFADGRQQPRLWQVFRTRQPYAPRDVPAHARAIETRRPVVIDDTSATTEIPRDWIEDYGLKSFMVVPLVRQDAVVGMMSLDFSARTQPFERWQVDLAMAIAGPLALSIDNTRLYDEVRERLLETSTLLAVGQLLSDRTPQPEAMRRVAREVGRALGADMVGAYFLDERREQLVPLTGYHVPPELLDHFIQHPIRMSQFPLLHDSWNAGRASWSPNPAEDPRFDRSWFEGLPPHSVLIAPAVSQGEPRGALFLVWWQPGREFSPAEIALVEAVGRQVGLALENAELARQTEAKLRETETLLSVAGALGSTLDLSGLFRHLLRQVHQIIDSDSVGVWTVGEDGDSILPLYGYRVPREIRELTLTLRPSLTRDAFYAQAAQTRQPVVSRDAMNDPGIPDSVKTVVPHRSQLFVPIVVNERMVGGIAAVWRERVCEFSERDLALLGAVARHAGVAIENARLFTENVRQVEQLSMLHELSRAVTGQLDRTAVLEAVSTQIARVLDVRNMLVALYDDPHDAYEVILRIRNGEADPAVPRRQNLRQGLLPVVLRSGQALRTDDYAGECTRHDVEPQIDAVPFRYWLGAPMRAGGQVIGAIALRSAERPFTVDDERVLGSIGDLAALALRSANLFEERSRAYRDLAAAQDQLVRTEKLRALGEMASGVAHDFNNLLAAILGRAQLVLHRLTDPKLRQWVGVIERAAIDGAQTVKRLQEFTRIRRDEPLVAVDLNQIVQGALDITQSRWREEALSRGVTIEVRQSLGPIGEIAGDAAELREALTNLILNAVDAMPQGGTLRLETTMVPDGVQLVVADTGIGMSESVRSRIFDPFFTTKGPRGTGLGLSITYGILSRHGATLDVETGEGRGTAFRLVFPRAEKLLRAKPAPDAVAVETTTPLSCLVVDDDEAVGNVIGDMIEASGHKALVLQEPAEAIARAHLARFDVVFTDLAMPGLSGWEVARDIKTRRPDVPIFMMTGFGVELSDDERMRHGLEAVLAKPLRIEDILAALARATERRGGAA